MRPALSAVSLSSESSAARPTFKPPSSARSTRTSNQLSIERPMNCTDTAYTSAPGSTATSANSSTRRAASREPNTPRFNFLRSCRSCHTTIRMSTPTSTPFSSSSVS